MTLGNVHSTAIVHPGARMASGVSVGAYALIGEHVEIEQGVSIGAFAQIGDGAPIDPQAPDLDSGARIAIAPNAVIGCRAILTGAIELGADVRVGHGAILRGPLVVGQGSHLFDYCVLGNAAQFPGRDDLGGLVRVGSGVTVREFVAINRPVRTAETAIGDGCYLMARTQIDHDCQLGRGVKTASGVTLGGSVRIDDNAYLGMNAVVHQGLRVGTGTMIGMNGVVTRHVPPYAVLVNRRFTRINRYGLQLRGATPEDLADIERVYVSLQSGMLPSRDYRMPWLAAISSFYAETDTSKVLAPGFPAEACSRTGDGVAN